MPLNRRRALPVRVWASIRSAWSIFWSAESSHEAKFQELLRQISQQAQEERRSEIEQVVEAHLRRLGVIPATTTEQAPKGLRGDSK